MRAATDFAAETGRADNGRTVGRRGWTLRIGLALGVFGLVLAVPLGLGAPAALPPASLANHGLSSSALEAAATNASAGTWPSVQVVFLVETTAYDGVYDPTAADPGGDPCAAPGLTVCEESNAVPFFQVHAGQIAAAIAAAHPGSNITFGVADFFASIDSYDDGDGAEFHVDVGNFTSAGYLQSAVNSSFDKTVMGGAFYYGDSDLSDNVLHSSSITALYGSLASTGFAWSTTAHHVVVLIGSTAPRATGYAENYSVSASDYGGFCARSGCLSPTCEPAYVFSNGLASPNCEGWVAPQNGHANDSIARLANNGPFCANSLGARCTVDTIALENGVTDPMSHQWAKKAINGSTVRINTDRILNASCALAAATGGSWDGPSFFTCPNGKAGNLTYVSHGSYSSPNTTNPTLLAALTDVGLGTPPTGHPGFNRPGDWLITDQFNNRVIEVNPVGHKIVWSFGSGNGSLCNPGPGSVIAPNDAERLANGLTLIAGTGTASCPDNRVIVVNEAGTIVWQYGRAGVTGNGSGLLNTPVFALQLADHDILIVDQGNNRLLEVNLAGRVVWSYGPSSGAGALNAPNSVERLPNGDLLIADENNNRAIQIDKAGTIVWHYAKGLRTVAFASRLTGGLTLIADSGNNRVVEINRSSHVVLSYATNSTPGSNANPNPTGVVEIRKGYLLIADQFNDRIIELNPLLQVVQQYGMTNAPGNGFDELNAPYSAVVIGDYLGTTPPPPTFR